ncbi:hypothetical protein C8Q80DRAFT_360932 [Daedaleopsis nitida]|nr:hypothetical protein C8Q80DRAFT_360932 [Daedaleopsis nitida]
MAQNIPFEILAQILSSFKEDKSMLSSSSMVSRMWLDVARPFLFASITLRSPGDITGSAKASLSHTALNDFIDRYPQLARSVKELFFRYISKPLNMADVSATLARLPRLRSIFLDRLKFADSPQATRPMPIRLACIQASDLCSIKGHPHPLFILCKYLTADRFIWDHSDLNLKEQTADDFPETLDRQPMTDLVMTTTATGEPDFAFFSLYVAPRTLRVLTVNLIAWVGAQSMCRFIDEAGQRLVCLQIELIWLLEYDQSDRSSIFRAHLSKHRTTAAHLFSVFPDPDSPLLGRSISKLTRLETLHIRVPACRSMCSWMRDDFPLRYAVFPAIFEPKCPPPPVCVCCPSTLWSRNRCFRTRTRWRCGGSTRSTCGRRPSGVRVWITSRFRSRSSRGTRTRGGTTSIPLRCAGRSRARCRIWRRPGGSGL